MGGLEEALMLPVIAHAPFFLGAGDRSKTALAVSDTVYLMDKIAYNSTNSVYWFVSRQLPVNFVEAGNAPA